MYRKVYFFMHSIAAVGEDLPGVPAKLCRTRCKRFKCDCTGMLPPRQAHRSRSADRVRWALTMLSAVALAFVVTRQPRVGIERRGRGLVEGDLLPGSRTRGSGGAASSSFADRRSSGGARGVSAARGDAQLHLGGDGGSGSSSGGGSDAVGSEADPDLEPQLEGRAACIAEATTMPPPVQGWVKKAGALPMRLLDGPQTRARHQAYFRWRDSGNLTLLTQETQVDGQPGARRNRDAILHAGGTPCALLASGKAFCGVLLSLLRCRCSRARLCGWRLLWRVS